MAGSLIAISDLHVSNRDNRRFGEVRCATSKPDARSGQSTLRADSARRPFVLADLLPEGVIVVEAFGDDPEAVVFPGEEEYVVAPGSKRGREFVTARRCARDALAQLGIPPVPIHVGPRREPLWPTGVAGAITHCPGYRAAAVSRAVASVGIDAEPHGPLPPGVLEQVASPGEREALNRLAREDPAVHWDGVLFTAKEAVYKAWFPLTGRWLGFEDVVVVIDPAAGAFHADLRTPGLRLDTGAAVQAFDGAFAVADRLLLSAVALPLASTPAPTSR